MKASNSIFGSKAESEAYKAIIGHVPSDFRLYANTPLAQIIKIEERELARREWNVYLKMSVDFVLTNLLYRPVLAIEFDGLSEGFSSGEKYIQKRKSDKDRYRKLKMDFKLRIFKESNLPLLIISSDEMKAISPEDSVFVINSIVGIYIAGLRQKTTIEKWDLEGKGKGKSHEEILWDLSRLETESSFKFDPVLQLLERSWDKFESIGAKWRMQSMSRPSPIAAMKLGVPFKMVGCRFVASGGLLKKDVSTTVWIRNFAGSEMNWSLIPFFIPDCGINPLKVAENIAWYLGQKRAIEVASGMG